ncbi:hypothetical protein MAR_022627 [Mya arenaria]|uniref:Uncharacterized protein n=1 Tax=Mya arenaria TaxID=6604 RepID=A0ABY7DNX9_MYAAR|nr:hypothetical protein MAR_022627 [Mya arenaria]
MDDLSSENNDYDFNIKKRIFTCHQSFSSSLKKTDPEINNNGNATIARRSSSIVFDRTSQCFIRGEKCDTIWDPNSQRPGRSWSMVETSIDSSHNILKAAEIKNDTSLKSRLRRVSNGSCGSLGSLSLKERLSSQIIGALKLKEEYADYIMTQKKVYKLTELRKREDFGDSVETYRSFYFKILLQIVWPELTFVYQNGKSDLVCSKDVTVGAALRDNKELEQSVHDASD